VCEHADSQVCLQRILKVDYELPPQVKASKECRAMLSRILVAQPTKRITIPEIQRHPWYLKDLPPGVVDMNDNLPPVSPNAQVGYRPPPSLTLPSTPKLTIAQSRREAASLTRGTSRRVSGCIPNIWRPSQLLLMPSPPPQPPQPSTY